MNKIEYYDHKFVLICNRTYHNIVQSSRYGVGLGQIVRILPVLYFQLQTQSFCS